MTKDTRTSKQLLEEEELLTFNQVARILQVSRSTVHRWVSEGHIEKVRVGRSSRFRSMNIRRLLDGDEPNGESDPPESVR